MSVKLEAGQWWRNQDGFIRYVIGKGPLMGKPKEDAYPFLVLGDAAGSDVFWCREDGKCYADESNEDLIEHLPCCDGFNWVPSEPPDGYRNLLSGEKIVLGVLYLDRYWKELPSDSDSIGKEWNAEQYHPMAVKRLQLRKGAWYEREDGAIVGPCLPQVPSDAVAIEHKYVWGVGSYRYKNDGTNCANPRCHLVREVDPPHKDYRPFANRDEALEYCDGWWIDENGHAAKVFRVSSSGVFFQGRGFVDFHDALTSFKRQDGTPFGMEVSNG